MRRKLILGDKGAVFVFDTEKETLTIGGIGDDECVLDADEALALRDMLEELEP